MMARDQTREGFGRRWRSLFPGAMLVLSFCLISALFIFGYPAAYQTILWQMGINPYHFPFLDTHGILSTAECYRYGIDVIAENPCDALGRTLDYSPFWLITAKLGLGTTSTMQAGLCLDLLFLFGVFFLPAVRGWPEAAVMTFALLSSAVALALERANLDLAVFVIGILAATWSFRGPAWRALGYALIILAALVKYYPAIMLVLAIRERLRFLCAIAAVTLGVAALFVAIEGAALTRALQNIEAGTRFTNNFGAVNLPRALSVLFALAGERAVAILEWAGALIAAACAILMAKVDNLQDVIEHVPPRSRALMLAGCTLILGCFFSAENAPYRCIYFLFVLPGLTQLWRAPIGAAARQRVILATFAVLLLLWGQFFQRALGQGLIFAQVQAVPANYVQFVFWFLREILWWWVVIVLLALLLCLIEASRAGQELLRTVFGAQRRHPFAPPRAASRAARGRE